MLRNVKDLSNEKFDVLSDYCLASQAFSKYGFIHESQVLMKKAITVYSDEVNIIIDTIAPDLDVTNPHNPILVYNNRRIMIKAYTKFLCNNI